MKRGIGAMSEDRPEAASEALACFDQALQLRETLPLDDSPALRYGLAACWLNRADALMRLGGGAQVAEAVRSCDQAIVLLRTLPLTEDPGYPRRLALAHHNRGLFLQAHGSRHPGEVLSAFEEALAVLDHPDAAGIDDRRYLLAVIWMNLASAAASHGTLDADARAREAALRAIGLVAGMENDDLAAAEVGLKARHALCRTFATRLAPSAPAEPRAMPDDVHEATDAVDEGLALIRGWEQKGVTIFRMVACDLFSFGGRVYLIYQPQFLQEYLDDNLDPASSSADYVESPEVRAVAQEIVDLHTRLYG